ncbi:histidine kinase/DNA gyrase B/HSP90-like ATPase [Chitinophaga dinghuensis]|uniref:histidine kinase n=1 Tax=Chitinophaga dinghuensis TaxID=1539050 RepID=A0A327WJC3_9BACT|nr:HAMP domain-containing sensor histidine kinase [Chitinophaga dinghuensis]RAJ87874.1 histidine kinase/DNA gyrase B/HSP90-like ATPase [Chitinophaga dinghuensis]
MFKQFIGWKFILVTIAVAIIVATIWFVSNLSAKIQDEERKKVATWVEAYRELLKATSDVNLNLATEIVTTNTTIPLIQTDASGNILDSRNIDTSKVAQNPTYLHEQLLSLKKQHPPFIIEVDTRNKIYNYVYYGDSLILKQVKYYPYIQLLVVALFIGAVLFGLSSTNRATQNLVWVGLAKETAHQLGTPLSSMEAWLEILRDNEANVPIVNELGKDLDRLKLITDRFSKIGSVPKLEEKDVVAQIQSMAAYIRRRAPQKVQISVHATEQELPVMISPPLFDWVIENLLKNALDAMEGKGKIDITIENHSAMVTIDVADTGKGIPKSHFDKIFKPGFSTKKRGWGLGLSLAKRIIEDYHRGRLSIKNSEVNKGTTFRIMLRK